MIDNTRFEQMAEYARAQVESGHLPCAVVAAANRERLLFRRAYGEGAGEEPQLWECAFPLASITKSVVSAGIARLVDSGKLDYRAPVIRYLPEFGSVPWRRKITLGDIFTHSTGLSAVGVEALIDLGISGEDGLDPLFGADPVYEPGTRFQYATHTYQILNAIVKRCLGMPMSRFLGETVFAPCDMTATAFNPVDPARAMPAVDHPAGERINRFGELESSGAGLWSTAPDLIRLAQALLAPGKLLSPEGFRRHTELQPQLPFAVGEGVGRRTWGWNREIRPEFTRQPESGFFHGGATGTLLWIDPEADLIFVFLTNRWGSGNEHCFIALDALYGGTP